MLAVLSFDSVIEANDGAVFAATAAATAAATTVCVRVFAAAAATANAGDTEDKQPSGRRAAVAKPSKTEPSNAEATGEWPPRTI